MKLIFALHPRCGSSVLSAALSCGCGIQVAGEPFHPFGNSQWAEKHETQTRTFEDNYDLLAKANTGLVKHIEWQLNEKDNAALLDKCDGIICLYRSYFIDFYISLHMCGTLKTLKDVSFWNFSMRYLMQGSEPESLNVGLEQKDIAKDEYLYNLYKNEQRPGIDIECMISDSQNPFSFSSLLKKHKQYLDIFKKHNAKIYAYEDIFNENVEEVFPELVDFLGYEIMNDDWKTILSKDNKIFQPELGKMIPNFNEVMLLREDLVFDHD